MYRWITMRRICQTIMVVLILLLAGNFTQIDAKTRPEVRLVLQITVDGLRADLINRYEDGFGKGGFRLLVKKGTYLLAAQDDRSYEVDLKGYKRTFPHPFGQAKDKLF